jgi:hypothetical protein
MNGARMDKLSPLVVLLTSMLACAAACGSENTGNVEGSTSSSSSGGSSGLGSSGTTSGDPPAEAGTKCQIATIGYDEGTVVQSLARGSEGDGGVKWTDLDNAKATDGKFASVTLSAGQESEELRITGFSFKLPAGAIFQGVEAQLDRQAQGVIVDGFVALVGVKNQISKGKFIATPWPTTIVGTHHYGQHTDTWGMDLNPPDVETAEFGVGIWVKRDPNDTAATATASVDSLKVRVAFCQP